VRVCAAYRVKIVIYLTNSLLTHARLDGIVTVPNPRECNLPGAIDHNSDPIPWGAAMLAASPVEDCPAFRLSRPARAQLVKAYEALSPEARQAVDLMFLALSHPAAPDTAPAGPVALPPSSVQTFVRLVPPLD
jgi:hypothetical protein